MNHSISLQGISQSAAMEIKQELNQIASEILAQDSGYSSASNAIAKEMFSSMLDSLLDGKSHKEDLVKNLALRFQHAIGSERKKPGGRDLRFNHFYKQRMSQFNREIVHTLNGAIYTTQIVIKEMEKELVRGIDQISSELSEAKKYQCHPKDLAQVAAQEADRLANELIEEEARQKAKRNRSKKKKAKQVADKAKMPVTKAKIKQEQSIEAQKATIAPRGFPHGLSTSELREAQRTAFILKLYQSSMYCIDLPRVRRWKTEDLEQIRQFTDKSKMGETMVPYQHLSDAEILLQRARHYLPGTERLWKSSVYREIYTFPTDRGAGVVAQLSYQQSSWNGILYFGGTEKYKLFHRYFEEVALADRKRNIFLDVQACETQIEAIEENSDLGQFPSQEWVSKEDFQVSMLENGALKFTYSDAHSITIYPLNKELLDQQLNSTGVQVGVSSEFGLY